MRGTVMMRGGLCAVMFAMAGCDPGTEGPPAEQGDPADIDRCGDLYFVDAAGAVAFPVCAPYIVDSQGNTWRFNLETGKPTHELSHPGVFTTRTDLTSSVYFETADCTGAPFMALPIIPRIPFLVLGKYRVRSDDAPWARHEFRSAWQEDGSCNGFQGFPPVRESGAFPLALEQELTPPASFQGPLHIEHRP
ncbi:hypothetical protein HUW62_04760 [Myxococcus sp. AM011]|uniref:hypothetical protein n=1 Tax=Myxococcus sp. AM011 TaxID=2745200 RepID=UPI001595D410|nr:hypothetical protein [Myxococcus sp. AM011]NVJ20534.1 hypothetical protein [Myxococcus sp. AM011]